MCYFDVGILAGGEGRRLNGRDGNGPPKAWVNLAGRFLWLHVYHEVMKLKPHKVYVVCHSDRIGSIPNRDNVKIVLRSGSYIGDLFGVVNVTNRSDRPLLIVHADAVLMTSGVMAELLEVARLSDAGFVWPGVPVERCFPESGGRRYVPGGKELARTNAMVVKPRMLNYDPDLIKAMENHDAFGEVIAGLKVLGFTRCIRTLLSRLPVSELCDCMGKALGCKIEVPIMNMPELAFDVDHPKDLVYAEDFIQSRIVQR